MSACATQGPGTGSPQHGETPSKSQQRSTGPTTSRNQTKAEFKTPEQAVESFVTQVLQKQYKEACLASAPAEKKDKQEFCSRSQAQGMLKSLHKAWAKPGVALPPEAEVEATQVTTDGNTASVSDSAITLDGRTLREIELINLSGNTKSFKFSFELRKNDDSWRITGWDISI